MTSTFGWLDTDRPQRQQMLELVDQFREQGTVDDLGIGQIRDAFGDLLFPGTSTLHTRLRYTLFIPWLLQRAGRERSAREMAEEMRASGVPAHRLTQEGRGWRRDPRKIFGA